MIFFLPSFLPIVEFLRNWNAEMTRLSLAREILSLVLYIKYTTAIRYQLKTENTKQQTTNKTSKTHRLAIDYCDRLRIRINTGKCQFNVLTLFPQRALSKTSQNLCSSADINYLGVKFDRNMTM